MTPEDNKVLDVFNEFRTIEEKESFVLALREQNYNPIGG